MIAEETYQKLIEALEFYADPENYYGITFLCDPPCGGFAKDFDAEHGHEQIDRAVPGAWARKVLKEVEDGK